jgi:hypothetical protein
MGFSRGNFGIEKLEKVPGASISHSLPIKPTHQNPKIKYQKSHSMLIKLQIGKQNHNI